MLDNCSNDYKRQLESIHNKAARIVSGAKKNKLCCFKKAAGRSRMGITSRQMTETQTS